ncbi:hypothetical protein [Bacillus sp. SM2101]|uniref:hypothetical protein n=1 Tax=Bacillus sp. SM2101 TaxID=2805366 RepID=UPI001BDF6DC3|nr:hypothetical protein [Bacillus sp. SM2101]
MNPNMSRMDVEDAIYKQSRRANDNLYKGLANFLYRFEDDFRNMLERLERIELMLQQDNDSKGINIDIKANKLFKSMSDNEKQELVEKLKMAMVGSYELK